MFIKVVGIVLKGFFVKLYFELNLLGDGSEIVIEDISAVYRISNVVIIACVNKWIQEAVELLTLIKL